MPSMRSGWVGQPSVYVALAAAALWFAVPLPAAAQIGSPDAGAAAPPTGGAQRPAKPAPAPATGAGVDPQASKVDAKALLQSGVKLLKQKDYLGALAVFRNAYERFPSVKLLLNIGTTLKLLGRNAEAANAYQRYLDDPAADPVRIAEVADVLATLDRVLGRLQIVAVGTSPKDFEIAVNGGAWSAASAASAAVALVRVDAGAFTIAARGDGYTAVEVAGTVASGQSLEVPVRLIAVAAAETETARRRGGGRADGTQSGDRDDDGVAQRAAVAPPRSRVGLMLRGHFHISPAGAAALVGPTVAITDRIEVNAGILLGRFRGGTLGSSFAFLPGRFRPTAAVGVLMVVDDGARWGARGAVGVEVVLTRNLSVFAELGGEHLFNPPMTVFANAFVPSAGMFGRL
jgi:hypothetical protein